MTPTWTQLLAERRVQKHETSKAELDELRAAVRRDLKDAAVSQLSDDRRFTIAYGAVLLLTKMVIACTGYRVTGTAHHYTMFQVLPLAMGKDVEGLATYFDLCRRKRNRADYESAHVASEAEVKELLQTAPDFQKRVEGWIAKSHPEFV
jgi:hypothetical protein